MTERKFKVLCFGAGAIGTYVGGSLTIHGHEVHFLDRQTTISKIKDNGLHLRLKDGDHTIHPEYLWHSLDDFIDKFNFDFAIVAVKSYDTDDLIKGWENFRTFLPPVLCLQNGVENEDKLKLILGDDRVISGTVSTAIGRIDNGIVLEKLRGIGIENKNKLTKEIIELFNSSGLEAIGFDNPKAMKWSKLFTNVTTNASSAILGMTPAEIMADSELYRIEIEELRETFRVMKAAKIPIVNLPGTAVIMYALIVNQFPLKFSNFILRNFIIKGRGGKMPSFFIDLQSKRKKSEVDYLNGAVVRLGNKVNVPTPVNKILNDILMKLTVGEIQKDYFSKNPEHYKKLFQK